MNEYCSSQPLEALQRIVVVLSRFGGEAFLYGSSVTAFRLGHDIDVLFVLAKEYHEHVYQQVAMVQEDSPFLLHPTLVTPAEFATNPRISKLSHRAIRLW